LPSMPSGMLPMLPRAEGKAVIERWNEQLSNSQDMLWLPTIRAALIAGTPWLFLSEFWTKISSPGEYGGLEGVGAFAEAMRAHGFTESERELTFTQRKRCACQRRAIRALIATFR
jgi:hypothetical protein